MNKNQKIIRIFVGVILLCLIMTAVLLWPPSKQKKTESIIPVLHEDNIEQKSNETAVNADTIKASSPLNKNKSLDATTKQFIDQSTAEIVQESEALINQPVHEGRETVMDKIRTESFEECFFNTSDTYGLAMMIPSFGSFFFSPGFYSSDVMMIKSMDRVRKLVTLTKQNPNNYSKFLKEQITDIGNSFDSHYREYLEEIHNMIGGRTISELEQSQKDRVRLTVAVYLLSENNIFDSLPEILNLSKSNGVRRKSPDEPVQADSWPINPQFLIYSMHRLVVNFPQDSLNEQAIQARNEYLKNAEELHISSPQTVPVATWDSPYKEDDYRFQIPKLKSEMYMRSQEKLDLTVYPIGIQLNSNDVDTLLDKLEDFCTIQFP